MVRRLETIREDRKRIIERKSSLGSSPSNKEKCFDDISGKFVQKAFPFGRKSVNIGYICREPLQRMFFEPLPALKATPIRFCAEPAILSQPPLPGA